MAFNINSGDTVSNFILSGGTSTLNATSPAQPVQRRVGDDDVGGRHRRPAMNVSNVESGSTLNLGANLNMVNGILNVQDSGSKLDNGRQ